MLNLSPTPTAANPNPVNAFLRGGNLQSAGLYAFAVPMASRGTTPILPHLIYSGLPSTTASGFLNISGGEVSNMAIEGLGLTEGYGYYGMWAGTGAPSGYVGPRGTVPPAIPTLANLPTSSALLEFDAGRGIRVDKLLIENGGMGGGGADLQCGLDEADPTHTVGGALADITLTDSRLDTGSNLAGASNPDVVLRLDAGCRGSTFDANSVYDGVKANVIVYGANLFSRTHLNSDAANSGIGLAKLTWPNPDSFGLAGLSDYGFYVIDNTSISETQCDVVGRACVLTIPYSLTGASSPGQITDTQMKCGSYVSTPPGYTGVEISAGTTNTTVTGTAPATNCVIYPFQLVRLDGPGDPSDSLCGNSNAAIAGCAGYQGTFAAGQVYTQPAVAFSGALAPPNLYAVPFFSPATGGNITKLAIDVTSISGITANQCLVGIYNASAQTPTTLVQIGTTTAVGTINSLSAGALSANLPSPGAELAPQTLYFLALACNGSVALDGVVAGSGLSVPLVGVPTRLSTATGIVSSTWTYPTSGTITLNQSFGSVTLTADAWVPNIYAKS